MKFAIGFRAFFMLADQYRYQVPFTVVTAKIFFFIHGHPFVMGGAGVFPFQNSVNNVRPHPVDNLKCGCPGAGLEPAFPSESALNYQVILTLYRRIDFDTFRLCAVRLPIPTPRAEPHYSFSSSSLSIFLAYL